MLVVNMLLKLPLSLITCAAIYFYVFIGYLSPLLKPEITHSAGLRSMALVVSTAIGPLCYALWLSFCLVLLLARSAARELNKTPFLFNDLSTAFTLFIPIMWIWFFTASAIFQLQLMFRFVLDSAVALEALGVAGAFVSLIILIVAVFLRGYMLMLYRSYEDSDAAQDKVQNFKEMFLCFTSSVFVVIIIMVFI